MIGRAMSIGIAKPIPFEFASMAVLMPTTWPAASRSGPPLLPGLIAASVWIRLVRWTPAWISMLRPVAEMIPVVTVLVYVPSGEPIAIASWPTLMSADRPIGAEGSPVASTLTIARSVSVSLQYTG